MNDEKRRLQSLLTEVHGFLEYVAQLGYEGLLPPVAPKKVRPSARPTGFFPANPAGAESASPRRPAAPVRAGQPGRPRLTAWSTGQQPTGQPLPPGPVKRPAGFSAESGTTAASDGGAPWSPRENFRAKPDPWSILSGRPDGVLGQGATPFQSSGPPAPVRTAQNPVQTSGQPTSSLDWMNSATSLEELNAALKSCQNCSLGKTRTTLFPGQGTPRAKLFIVLDPPVGEDVTEGRVPSGPRAELLRNIIVKGLKMDPSEVYVTSVCKCPGTDEFIPEKGPLSACFKILAKEIQLVMPKVILTMGPSAGCTVSRQNTHMELLRKKRLVLGASKIPLRMTFGLSIMVDDDVVKRQCWQDLKGVLQLLAKP